MSFTTVRVTGAGVVLFAGHAARLGPDASVQRQYAAFARTALPGVYALTVRGDRLEVEPRPGSRLVDGLPTRCLPSPLPPGQGPIAKPRPPSAYGAVRAPGIATLLTDAAGEELFESCAASLLAWDGRGLVLVPEDRPRVASLAEAFLAAHFQPSRRPLLRGGAEALLLVNAVRCAEPARGSRPAFPAELRAAVERALEATACARACG